MQDLNPDARPHPASLSETAVRLPSPVRLRAPRRAPRRVWSVEALRPEQLAHVPDGTADTIRNAAPADTAPDVNALFRSANRALAVGGRYEGCAVTCEIRKRQWFTGRPAWAVWPVYAAHFAVRRVLPRLSATRALYAAVTGGRGVALSKTELLGRLVYCGFDITEAREDDGVLAFVAEKRREPSASAPSSCGLVLRMSRIGQGGGLRTFYKLRTMHPYAEHLQAYVFACNALAESGKMHDDFRVTTWGRTLRRLWIDELPMLLNWLRGDVKLFGVRPLSVHYASLYPPELQVRRAQHRPGLVPPFYVDLPQGFDAICDSERRYLDAFDRSPVATDARYFARAVWRIVVERARSQ